MSNHPVMRFKTYLNVLFLLLFLTVVTVAVAQINFGMFNVVIAMVIATIKAAFVLLYFMHLKYDDKLYWGILGIAVLFVFLLYLLSVIDIISRIIENIFL